MHLVHDEKHPTSALGMYAVNVGEGLWTAYPGTQVCGKRGEPLGNRLCKWTFIAGKDLKFYKYSNSGIFQKATFEYRRGRLFLMVHGF